MTQADLGQGVATSGAPSCSADVNQVGLHAERLMNLYPSTPATVTRDEGLMLYRDMTLGRRFEDKCAEMYYRGKMFGFVHLYNGQEAVSTGVIKAMK
ncbi:MAG: thiamine pyrophosphate-dependent enzyme, partial [Vulcanococcus sp.]